MDDETRARDKAHPTARNETTPANAEGTRVSEEPQESVGSLAPQEPPPPVKLAEIVTPPGATMASELARIHGEWESVTRGMALQLGRIFQGQRAAINVATQAIAAQSPIPSISLNILQSLGRQFANEIEAIRREMQGLPDRTREALAALGQHGWYLYSEMPYRLFEHVGVEVQDGRVAGVLEGIEDYYERQFDLVVSTIQKVIPHRAHLVESGAQSHREGRFALAVLMFLTQADGACYEVTALSLYGREQQVPRTARWVGRQEVGEWRRALLYPLTLPLPVSASGLPTSEELRRHAILHGIDIAYGTRRNSLKALSLLAYVASTLNLRHDF